MRVRFLSIASRELSEAFDYYHALQPSLGLKFLAEVENAIQRMKAFPNGWRILSRKTRRCRTKSFPYGLIYEIRRDHLLVIAVMHLQRHPEAWRKNVADDSA